MRTGYSTRIHIPLLYCTPPVWGGLDAAGTHPLLRVGDPLAVKATVARDKVRTTWWLGPEARSPTSLGPLPLSCEDGDFFFPPIKYFMTQRGLMGGFRILGVGQRGKRDTLSGF